MRFFLLAASLLSLTTLPSCLPVGGCGGPEHSLHVGGKIALHVAPQANAACGAAADYSFTNAQQIGFELLPDDQRIVMGEQTIDETEYEDSAIFTVFDVDGAQLDFDLLFEADGTANGTATRTLGDCRATYDVTGTFTPSNYQ